MYLETTAFFFEIILILIEKIFKLENFNEIFYLDISKFIFLFSVY